MTTPTRTREECRELADRQHLGEDLGFSDAFVAEWRTKTPIKARPAPLPDPPIRATVAVEKPAAKEPHWTETLPKPPTKAKPKK